MERIPGPSLDERLWKLGSAMRAGHLDEWGFTFAKSILRQAKRPGWQPSAKQDSIINKLLAEASRSGADDVEQEPLIDHGDLFTAGRRG